jgi:hypothetical protein
MGHSVDEEREIKIAARDKSRHPFSIPRSSLDKIELGCIILRR